MVERYFAVGRGDFGEDGQEWPDEVEEPDCCRKVLVVCSTPSLTLYLQPDIVEDEGGGGVEEVCEDDGDEASNQKTKKSENTWHYKQSTKQIAVFGNFGSVVESPGFRSCALPLTSYVSSTSLNRRVSRLRCVFTDNTETLLR